jgi:hypothetical protein
MKIRLFGLDCSLSLMYQFSPLKIIQSRADFATHHRNPPQPPFAKGGRGDFWEIFSEGKSYLFLSVLSVSVVNDYSTF